MLAEMALFNAGFSVVKQFIGNGRDLSDCFGAIGQMVDAKEDLRARQQKNKKSFFANDAAEFGALEQVARAEDELKQFMLYHGRAGLWADWLAFEAKARKSRMEARRARIETINKRMHYAGIAVACGLVVVGLYAGITILFAIKEG